MQTGRVPVFFQAERGGRRPEALVAAARVSGARRAAARCAARQNGPAGVMPGFILRDCHA